MKQLKHKSSKPNPGLNKTTCIALLILFLLVFVGGWFLAQSGVNLSHPISLMQFINSLGWVGVLLYIGFVLTAIVIAPIPSTPVTVAAGAVWGPVAAGIYGVIGVFLGSLTAYFIARTLGRSAVRALTGKVIHLSNHRGEVYLGWLAFVIHAIPVMPYELMSYGAGLSGLPLPIYATAAFLGSIPCTFFLTYMGSAFTVGRPLALSLAALFLGLLVILPWGIKRHNWFGLKDVIQIE